MIGVRKSGNGFRIDISINGKRKYIDTFATELEAALVYDRLAKKYHGGKAKSNLGRRLTVNEEQVYRLVSMDFYGLPIRQAAMVMGWNKNNIIKAIKRIKEKCPSLMPINMAKVKTKMLRYESWMDPKIITRF